jgi:3-oxoacyl-[acyl-carrier protein] reductase
VLSASYITSLIQKAAAFGNGKIHIIVNNAGYTWDGVIHKMTDKQWQTILDLHCTAPFKIVREAAPYFRVRDGESRCVVNVSSTSGLHGNAGQSNYAMAKAGVVGLTKTIAKELVNILLILCLIHHTSPPTSAICLTHTQMGTSIRRPR